MVVERHGKQTIMESRGKEIEMLESIDLSFPCHELEQINEPNYCRVLTLTVAR